ncbi:hypothetical protein C4561_02715 [candidate division WWE3 bacterium]|jgi:anaerobic selenocysteine-containing dehydrogenase|uniref:4Fe-4S Mo/W bis-MGD-type domain-containing protein n=1 Tax=candidate division WWE3 bacterium TaxID=2053526 RepID=A0A3A4ZDC8_UNCKA|nr:MAG: hypothetical protein C4561_02715 [candidate division WWE3 bacterium]
MAEIAKTICLHCPPGCGIDVHVENNKPVKVEGMMESIVGPICVKAEVIPEWYEYGLKNRLQYPLKKGKDGVGWEEISWDEALDIMCEKLTEIKERYGPQAFAMFGGQISPNRDWDYLAKRFFDCYGSPSFYSCFSICWTNRAPSAIMTYGQYAVPTLHGSKCIVVWAGNPVETVPFAGQSMLAKKREDEAKLLVVDPRRITLAKEADIHAQVKPGSDVAFGLALLNVIITEGLYDKEFVEKWTVGFDKLAVHVKDYPPERVEKITTVPASTIRDFARTYATTKPATIFWGNALDHCDYGFDTHRCIQILMAITGNLDVRGGSRQIPYILNQKVPVGEEFPLKLEDIPETRLYKMKPAGEDDYPLWLQVGGEPAASSLFDAIIEEKPYAVKGLLVESSNMLVSWADTNMQKKAFSKLDFLVVYDINMTETAEFADLVLPACTFLEQQMIYHYVGRPMYVLMTQAIQPPEGCWPDMKFWLELAKRMGYGDKFPWNTADDVQNHIMKPVGLTVDDLRQDPGGVFFSDESVRWKKYEQDKFRTPSGKVEIYSDRIKQFGGNPLPTYESPYQSEECDPVLTKRYPLILITGTRQLEFNHSMLHTLPSLRRKVPYPAADIHTSVAQKLGIADGDDVIIETNKGMITMKARVTDDIHPQTVSIPHAWQRMANGNLLTSMDKQARNKLTGCPGMRIMACRVQKVIEVG